MSPAVERNVVIVACAVSSGVHGALVRDHLAEGTGTAVGFAGATVLLAALVVVLTRSPSTPLVLLATSAVLGGLLASYALAITAGFPGLHPGRESVEGIALATKAIEALGLVAAVHLIRPGRAAARAGVIRTKGVPT